MKHENVNPATGAAAPGFSRGSDKYSHNQWSGHSNDGRLVNKGRGPTKGNQDHKPMTVGKPATKDAYRPVPMCHEPGIEAGKDMFPASRNPQMRTPGGTRAWDPKQGQNYVGDPDRINVSGYDMGDGKMTKGGRPVPQGKTDGINYGPKKQY